MPADLDLDALARLAGAANSDPLRSTVLADFITVFGPDVVCALITALRTQEALVRELVEAGGELLDLLKSLTDKDGFVTLRNNASPVRDFAAALAKVKP